DQVHGVEGLLDHDQRGRAVAQRPVAARSHTILRDLGVPVVPAPVGVERALCARARRRRGGPLAARGEQNDREASSAHGVSGMPPKPPASQRSTELLDRAGAVRDTGRGMDEEARPMWESELIASDAVGRLMEFWGFKRNMGRIWTVLYLSDDPLSAHDL